MAADFEEEGRLAGETVTRPSSNPGMALGALLFVVVALALALFAYSAARKQSRVQNASEETFATARLQPGIGFNQTPATAPDQSRFVIPTPAPVVPPAAPTPVVLNPSPTPASTPKAEPFDDSEAKRLAELERLRKEAEAKRQARLRSPMLIVSDKDGVAGGDPSKVTAEDKEEDPHRRFLSNSERQVVRAYGEQLKRLDALVPQGYMIRATLETAVQSDLAGMVRASTTEDVYSFDGRRVLIPKGTMLTGEYKSGLTYGQTRVFIVWTRMLRADGVSMMLQSPGTDSLGRSGVTGEVDTHFWKRFGSAAMLTLAGGVAQFASALGQNNNQFQGQQFALDPTTGTLIPITGASQSQILLNARQIGAQTIAQSVTRMAEEALRNDIKVPPTVHLDQGTPVIVFVKRDLDFSDLYPDPVKEALYELRHPRKAGAGKGCDALAMGDAADLLPSGCEANRALVTRY